MNKSLYIIEPLKNMNKTLVIALAVIAVAASLYLVSGFQLQETQVYQDLSCAAANLVEGAGTCGAACKTKADCGGKCLVCNPSNWKCEAIPVPYPGQGIQTPQTGN